MIYEGSLFLKNTKTKAIKNKMRNLRICSKLVIILFEY